MAYNISYQLGAPPAAFSQLAALKNLRASGFIPRTIYDIGAFQGQWSREAGRVFKAAEIIQFEANSDNAPNLRQNGRRFFIVALAARMIGDLQPRNLHRRGTRYCDAGP